jgi:RimJ/RimL family protein N-acetyltransferase
LRWRQFDFKLYLLGYFFHPSHRGKGLKEGVFRQIVY